MDNQVTVPITTANSNALLALTYPLTITTTAISSASSMVNINPAPAISVPAYYLGIFEEINKENKSEGELGPPIFSQLIEVAMKYWSEESKNPVVVNKILDGLKIPTKCSDIDACIKCSCDKK